LAAEKRHQLALLREASARKREERTQQALMQSHNTRHMSASRLGMDTTSIESYSEQPSSELHELDLTISDLQHRMASRLHAAAASTPHAVPVDNASRYT